ncbi:CidA/LrgA family protein [Beijerinckia indica]|uniref:LrgA family protein n=1 Tax=Beijerinckia indica subsp. indica (strain ATCC 9039 / DSM 1715 / NCIMB 8712) TaxID=395963 RepID=B2IEH8_BEII9|nr:CidA/LrgA family protein [Beijerinckia indica]ACB95576.1 LrgA family protein [Beijerinckia indica subsp. indica ATCC 9039]
MIHALSLLLLCQLLGEIAVRALGISLPGPVAGLLFLFLWLSWRGWQAGDTDPVVPPEIETLATTLLRYLAVLFIPVAVGVMEQVHMLRAYGLGILLSVALSGIAALAVTSLVFEWVMRRTLPPGNLDFQATGETPQREESLPETKGADTHA